MPGRNSDTSWRQRIRIAAGRKLFGALYASFAPFYDHVSRFFFAGQWTVWQRYALDLVEGRDVLEIGYGTGDLLVEMCRRGYSVQGVDASSRMRIIALRKLRRAGCSLRPEYGSAFALPYSDESFDTLVSTFPSEYILDPATWREAHRVLCPGGRYVIVVSGELLPVDHRSKLLVRFHRLVYGGGTGAAPSARNFVGPGFDVELHARSNGRGIARILLARKLDDVSRA